MAENKNQAGEFSDEGMWNNFDNFINDFAKNNESVSEEIGSVKNKSFNNVSMTDKKLKSYGTKILKNEEPSSSLADVSKRLLSETDDNFSQKYKGLQTDIKSLLAELQEIKKARLDLESRLDSIR